MGAVKRTHPHSRRRQIYIKARRKVKAKLRPYVVKAVRQIIDEYIKQQRPEAGNKPEVL